MKHSTAIYALLSLAAIYLLYQYSSPTVEEGIDEAAILRKEHPDAIPPHFEVCIATANKPHESSLRPPSLNYRGPSLVSKSTDGTDLVICPGDTFGDLNGTYVTLKDCYLAMYHQDKLIWSSPEDEYYQGGGFVCALSLQKDGNLVLRKEGWQSRCTHSGLAMNLVWESQTGFRPSQTELRVRDQQLQIVQTFQNGTQRIFYTGKNTREFQEDMGAPKQVAEKFLLKNHTNDAVILRPKEYIGDLKGMHLILQTNCDLQLKNGSQTIWFFAAYLKPDGRCTLRIQGNSIGIPELTVNNYRFEGVNILPFNTFTVLQSNITFSGDQLVIIQTLSNGSEITFYSEPGQDNGLKLKKELRQIGNNSNNITVSSKTIIERLDYIGDLEGLHLILRDNCAFTLANGQKELWRLTQHLEPNYKSIKNLDGPFMECNVQLNQDGTIKFNRFTNNNKRYFEVRVFGERSEDIDDPPSRFEIFLEDNLMVIALEYQNKTPEIYHAGANTNGTWLRFVSANSVILSINDTKEEILPNMGYIGDIHGVFTMVDRRGNWILFNKTQVIWESGSTQEPPSSYFYLVSTRDGAVDIKYGYGEIWSTKSQTVSLFPQAEFSNTELLVNNDGMWLINSFIDGTVDRYKALEGTNRFILTPKEYEIINP